jgi:O-antigen/teichoic acid export membrane protein
LSVTSGGEASPLSASPIDDPHAEADQATQEHHHAARRGIKLLMLRQVGLQLFTFLGGVVIARTLGPGAYGLFGISSYLVNMLAQFADFGLAPSFIQRKAELTERDLRVGFTLQQILLSLVVIIIMAISPWLVRLYPHAPPDTVWFVRAMAFSLYLTSWRTMSALQLERNLRYDRLAGIEVIEALIYQSLAVTLALMHKGTWSFVIAVLAQGLIGTILVYRACPWKVRLAFDARIARDILRYGIPFQVQMLFNQIGDWVIPLFVGSRLGPSAVGLLTWSSANSKKPLMVVDNITRVAFPHFSRIQHDQNEVERTLIRYLTSMLMLGSCWFALLVVAGPALVRGIYLNKWEGAILTLAIYAGSMLFDIICFVMAVSLNALGKVAFLARIALARSVLYMALSVLFVYRLGYNGVPVALLTAQAIVIPWIFNGLGAGSLRRVMVPNLWLVGPTAISLGVGLAVRAGLQPLDLPPLIQATILIPVLLFAYGLAAWPLSPAWLRNSIGTRLHSLLQKIGMKRTG